MDCTAELVKVNVPSFYVFQGSSYLVVSTIMIYPLEIFHFCGASGLGDNNGVRI